MWKSDGWGAVPDFCIPHFALGMFGTIAGNLALTLGARGGVYIAGGVVRAMGAAFDRALFRQRFEAHVSRAARRGVVVVSTSAGHFTLWRSFATSMVLTQRR